MLPPVAGWISGASLYFSVSAWERSESGVPGQGGGGWAPVALAGSGVEVLAVVASVGLGDSAEFISCAY
jgi:hypothetical protein